MGLSTLDRILADDQTLLLVDILYMNDNQKYDILYPTPNDSRGRGFQSRGPAKPTEVEQLALSVSVLAHDPVGYMLTNGMKIFFPVPGQRRMK